VALFYFPLRDGQDVLLDPEGAELSDLTAVVKRALLEARGVISADALRGLVRLDMRLDVEDAAGALVHRLSFSDAVKIVPTASAA
jgi:hypothetical protein